VIWIDKLFLSAHIVLVASVLPAIAYAQTALADPRGSGPIISAVQWLQGTLLGTIAAIMAVTIRSCGRSTCNGSEVEADGPPIPDFPALDSRAASSPSRQRTGRDARPAPIRPRPRPRRRCRASRPQPGWSGRHQTAPA